MIQLDAPPCLAPDQFTTTLYGWYAGERKADQILLQVGESIWPCRLEPRPDVLAVHPALHVCGFRTFVDFLTLTGEVPDDSHVHLQIWINDEVHSWYIPVVAGWSVDLRRMRASFVGAPPDLGLGLRSGDSHYRAYVGLPDDYDLSAAGAFQLLTLLGLRQHHRLVDVGCGSLRCGRLFIPYLNPGNYLGIEPNGPLLQEGIQNELGTDMIRAKRPLFLVSDCPAVLDAAPCSNFALANSIFSHASRTQISGWLKHLSANLCLSGALAATFLTGPDDYDGDTWVYPECIRYRVDTMHALAETYGFRFDLLDWRHLHGQSWALFSKPNFDSQPSTPLTWNARIRKHS